MEGDGIGLDGRRYHFDDIAVGGWVNSSGRAGGTPYWRRGAFWRNRMGGLTFPLEQGGWSAGAGVHYVEAPGVTFAPGPSRPLKFYASVAVDPKVIPLGTKIYIPAYRQLNGGWFRAADVGGAIRGRHIDVYRPPPADGAGRHLIRQRVLVAPPD
jgi:3D (Asp-Asp-Asp) domain-containing protein